jgi:hypothetical protein
MNLRSKGIGGRIIGKVVGGRAMNAMTSKREIASPQQLMLAGNFGGSLSAT